MINIQRPGEFVVNMTDEPLAQAMHETSGDFPPDIGEPDYLGPETRALDQDRRAAAGGRAVGDGVQDLEGRSTSTATGC